MRVIVPKWPQAELTNLLAETIEDVSRENSIWIPSDVIRYLARVLSFYYAEGLPHDFDGVIKYLHDHIPKNKLARYDRLQELGDRIVNVHIYWGVPSCIATVGHAQNYFDEASKIGRQLHEPAAPVLERIAEDLDDLKSVLRATRNRLAA